MPYPILNDTSQEDIHPALHNEVVDLEQHYNLVTGGGATSQQMQTNAAELNQAFTDHLGANRRLRLPNAAVHIEGEPVGIDVVGDTSAVMEIFGYGRRSSRIVQNSAGLPAMRFRTTGGNLRDIYCHDFMLKGQSAVADYGLELWKVGYSTFERLALWTCAGVYLDDTVFDNNFNALWFLNISGYSIEQRTGTSLFTNCIFGEDCGSIISNGGRLYIADSYMREAVEKVTSGGINAMGESMFICRGDGNLFVSDCKINVHDSLDNLVNVDNGIIRFNGNTISMMEAHSRLLAVRVLTGPQYVQFTNNAVEFEDAAGAETMILVDRQSSDIHDSIFANNELIFGTNWTAPTIDNHVLDPTKNNVYVGNVIQNTTGV